MSVQKAINEILRLDVSNVFVKNYWSLFYWNASSRRAEIFVSH